MAAHNCWDVTPLPRPFFSKAVVLDWYDGATSGLARCSQCGETFKYDLVDWDSQQDTRIFALASVPSEEFGHVSVLSDKFPNWKFPSKEAEEDFRAELARALARAERPDYVVASDWRFDNVRTIKKLNGSALERIPNEFDGLPSRDDFSYWSDYLGLVNRTPD